MTKRIAFLLFLFTTLCAARRPARAETHLTIMSHNDRVLNKAFGGVGFAVTAHLGTPSERDLAEVLVKRWRETRPHHALVAYASDWNAETAVPLIKRIYGYGELWIAPIDDKVLDADKAGTMLEQLVKTHGLQRVTRYIIRSPWSGAEGREIEDATANAFKAALDEKLKALGLAIRVSVDVPGVVIPTGKAQDAEAGLALAGKVIEATNGGESHVTFMDWNDRPGKQDGGLFEWKAPEYKPRDSYYAAALLAKLAWAPSQAYGSDFTQKDQKPDKQFEGLNFACLRMKNDQRDADTLIFINRTDEAMAIRWGGNYTGGSKHMGKVNQYVYPAADPYKSAFGDLPPPRDANFYFGVTVPPQALYIVSSLLKGKLPMRHSGVVLRPEKIYNVSVSDSEDGGKLMEWEHVAGHESCFYRIYRMNMPRFKFARKEQIGSTVANRFVDRNPPEGKRVFYGVVAVDMDGNPSE